MLRLAAVVICAAVFVGAAGPGAFGELSLGTTARDHARYEAAIRHYSRVIEWPDVSKSNLGNAYYNRANALYSLGRHVRAIQDYAESLRFNPSNADVHYNRGNAYADLGNHGQAISDYSQAIRLDPDYHYAYYNWGNSYLSQGDFQRATADFKKAYSMEPDDLIYQGTMEELGLLR